jgi:rubredoxin
MGEKVIAHPATKRIVDKEKCPKCGGGLDTGWECNDCGFDAHFFATGKPFPDRHS